ncbi:MAG: hypothetical protein HUU20_24065 [Pirellulales bacterium]|nr:hypothetical protein [Pirellulales bacterium]
MKTELKWLKVVATLLVAVSATAVRAGNYAGDAVVTDDARLKQLEAEVAALRENVDCGGSCLSDCFSSQSCGLYGGFGVVLASPFFHNPTQNGIEVYTFDGENDVWTGWIDPLHYDHEFTPKFWLGYVGASGFGVRARTWLFDHEGDTTEITPGIDAGAAAFVGATDFYGSIWADGDEGESLLVAHSLRTYYIDLEITQQMHFLPASIQFGGGLRVAGIETTYHAAVHDAQGFLTQRLDAEREFEGAGPTVSLEMRREIGCSGFAVLANLRGSVLFGEVGGYLREDEYTWNDFEFASMNDTASTLGIGELELGFEHTTQLASGGRLFFRGTYEGQLWLDAGTPNSADGDLGFEGFGLSVGLDR